MVTSIKIDIFVLVTTRPIAHFGGLVCIPNCFGEFGTDTGQPFSPIILSHTLKIY